MTRVNKKGTIIETDTHAHTHPRAHVCTRKCVAKTNDSARAAVLRDGSNIKRGETCSLFFGQFFFIYSP